jgi:hypothetical protein
MKGKLNSPNGTIKEGGFLKSGSIKDQSSRQSKPGVTNKTTNSANHDQLVKYFSDLKQKPKYNSIKIRGVKNLPTEASLKTNSLQTTEGIYNLTKLDTYYNLNENLKLYENLLIKIFKFLKDKISPELYVKVYLPRKVLKIS